MALKAILASIAGLAPDIAKEYTQRADGKFVLSVDPVDGMALEDVAGLRSGLEKERQNVDEIKKQLKSFEGLDAAKARDALEKLEKMKTWTPEEKVQQQIEAKIAEIRVKFEKDLNDRDGRIKSLTSSLEHEMIVQQATAEIAKRKGVPELLLPHIRNRSRVVEKDGKHVVEILDKDGNLDRSPKDGYKSGKTMSELVEEMQGSDIFSRAFDGSGTGGSGSTSPKGSGSGSRGWTLTSQDAKDPMKYRAAREAAEKAGQSVVISD